METNIDAAAYDLFKPYIKKLPPNKKEIDHHVIIAYWPTRLKEVTNWFPFLSIIEYTVHKIENEITLLL